MNIQVYFKKLFEWNKHYHHIEMHSFRQQFTVSLEVMSGASSTGNSFRPEPTLPFDAAFIATSRRQYDTYLIPIFASTSSGSGQGHLSLTTVTR